MPLRNKYTVTLNFFDGFTTTRDLIDHRELERYLTDGFDWKLVRSIHVTNHPHAES